ncbi:MAG TPA: class I SAM-dependent methyltransferase [Streptosporangiaceae bacterium]|nr:class I SAM-dependent methyltransferase [Streptosporangiaceae bacterium]
MTRQDSSSVSTTQIPAWEWDETLYLGSASYYARGRMPYSSQLVSALAKTLKLTGAERLLDCGCGPGSLTLLLAPLVAEAVGIDADAEMIAQARLAAETAGISNVSWRTLRAEKLPAGLGQFSIITFAQSIHWMQQHVVAEAVRGMLTRNGACIHIFATTHQGTADAANLPRPMPPRAQIAELITRYLGPTRRAGQGLMPSPTYDTATAMRAAGFEGPHRVELPDGEVRLRTEDEIVASVFSLSSAAPHLFGGRVTEFERELRALLRATAPDGQFAERMRGGAFEVWRPGGRGE